MVRILKDDPVVEYAELNYMAHMTLVPNDTYYGLQWNLHDATYGGINMEGAWDIETGDPNVIIAILDTGVAYEDFNEFIQASDFAETHFVPGYDFINDDNHPNDDQGHGTHVAGTLAQSTNNEIGVAGIAFGCSLCPIKVLDEEGYGDHFTISQGIYFAIAQGARVINLSLGSDAHSRTLREAVAYAYDQGVTIVCSAGNEFLKGNAVSYPAAYDDYCIAVGATAFDKIRAPYSSTGDYVDLCAPGGNVLMDLNHDGYVDGILQQTFQTHVDDFAFWFLQGTSMAAPHVSGAAALLVSQGITKPDRVREALENTAVDLGQPGWDAQYGWGLVDVEAALLYWDDESSY
jgi:serine protease